MSVRLRAAQPGDTAAIAQVHVATWRAAYAGMVPDAYLTRMTERCMMRQWQALLGPRRRRDAVLVAETDKAKIVGFGSCGPSRPGPLPYRGEIFTLYVDPDWQGRGLGRALLEELFANLLGQRCPDALIWVLAANPSRFFYEALGGKAAASRKEAFAGKMLDETAYAWPDLAGWLERQHLDSDGAGT